MDSNGVFCAKWSAWTAAASEELAAANTSSHDPAFMLYTSGSGGTPKAAVHRHADMLVTSRNYARAVLGLRADDLTFSVSKLFFAYGLGNGMYFPLSVGARTVLNPERTNVAHVVEMVARHRRPFSSRCRLFMPRSCGRRERPGHRADFLPSVCAYRPVKRCPLKSSTRGSGNSQSKSSTALARPRCCTCSSPAVRGMQAGSCGFPVPGYEAKIVDDNGESVRDGEIGNLWVRGASAFCGVLADPRIDGTHETRGLIVTGDKFFCDSNGYFHYCGRADDMLKVAGMWVSRWRWRTRYWGTPHVAEAAVVGATDERGLAHSVAHIVLRGNVQGSEELAAEICEHVKARLVSYKVPREVRFCSELPKTVTGKIQRFKLRGTSSDR